MKALYTLALICACGLVRAQQATCEWLHALGGAGYESGEAIAVDRAGNVYTAGLFLGTDSADFDPGLGIANLQPAGLYLSKLNAAGQYVWAKRWLGSTNSGQFVEDLELDAWGNVYVCGSFWDTKDFDPGPGVLNITSTGRADAYIAKFDSSGNLAWVRTFGADSVDNALSLAIDAGGRV